MRCAPEPGFFDAPPQPTRLEELALDAGPFPNELRGYLRQEIARRTAEKESPLHRLRARDVTPGARERAWVRSLPTEVRERAVEAMAALGV